VRTVTVEDARLLILGILCEFWGSTVLGSNVQVLRTWYGTCTRYKYGTGTVHCTGTIPGTVLVPGTVLSGTATVRYSTVQYY